jgi:capsular exopolysaccharide synthesis family protein
LCGDRSTKENIMEIRELVSLLWRNLKYLILGLALGTALGVLAVKIEMPVYEATTKILVSRTRQQSNADMLPLSDEQLVAINMQLAKSQPVLEEVSNKLGSKVDVDSIQVSDISNTLIVQIKVQDSDPSRAAAIANLLVEVLIQQNETLLSGRYAAFEEAISSQIDQVQVQIDDLQTQISQIQDTSVQEQLTQVNRQIDQLKTEISTLEQEIAGYPLVPTAIERASQAEKQAQLGQLNSLMSLYQQIQTNLTYTGKPGESGSALENPRLATLQSTLDLYQEMHLSLITNQETVHLARMQNRQNVVQIVSAVPSKNPVRPIPILYILLGAVVGLFMAVTFVVVRDHFDDSLRTPLEIEEKLGLPVLGLVFDTPRARKLAALHDPYSMEAEAFRALGASVEMVGVERNVRTLLVLNGDPREARTTIAANLAAVNAQQGKQVILVDGDLKHPHLHTLLGIENQIGLADLLDGRCDIQSACRALPDVKGLSLIPSGFAKKEATAWLDSEKWGQLLSELKKQADMVIVDSPPADVADAQILAAKMNAVLMVIRSGKTRLETAKTTLKRFQLIGARVVGAVFYRTTQSPRLNFNFIRYIRTKTVHRGIKPQKQSLL